MGTPDIAVSVLEALAKEHEVVLAVSQPDKPKGRGGRTQPTPVKEAALALGIPVFQPGRVRSETCMAELRKYHADVIVVIAFGQIIPKEILEMTPYGCINIHASLLPKYRGAAPINWAVLNGETETGVSIMYMAKELDAGDVILQKSTSIGETEDAQELTRRLAELGAEALSETVKALGDGTAARIPQDHEKHTYAPMLGKELSPVDWTRSAHEISCQVRGLIPWPCAATDVISGEEMKLYAVQETGEETSARPGTVTAAGKQGIDLACGDGKILRVTELQAKGGKRMSAGAYLLGHPIQR